ncbi:MAG: hypothetical protein Fur0037_15690 [Planctomycetota bacterium]
MPNLVNQVLLQQLKSDFEGMGSCVVVSFDKLRPEQDVVLRSEFRKAGIKYRVVQNRLAARAFAALDLDLKPALKGKCAVAIAEKEKAITAAKLIREFSAKEKKIPLEVVGGVVEGTVYLSADAAAIADLPDRPTIQARLATAIAGPARSLATILNGVASGMARCIQAKIDKAGESPAS